MNSKEIKALEKLNSYIIEFEDNNPIYLYGEKIVRLKKHFPFHMFSYFIKKWKYRKMIKKSRKFSNEKINGDFFYVSPQINSEKKGVVYTCVTDEYDSPRAPLLENDCLDWICFTDNLKEAKADVWKKQLVSMESEHFTNNVNRFYKFHPFDLFENKYDYAIYIDGNVWVVSDVTGLYEIAHHSKIGIAMHKHFSRDCAYDDVEWCKINKRGNKKALEKQIGEYCKQGFPKKFGLFEATIIVVDLSNLAAKKIMKEWWDEFLKWGSKRDQLIFPYLLWKNGYSIDDVGCLGNNEYKNPKFRIFAHKGILF